MLKVGLVGCGGISGAHVPAWNKFEDAELVAVCDVRQEMMDKYDGPRQYHDFDEMLEKEELDILDICLPTYLHPEFSIKAMEKGINVVCEKPISLKSEDVRRVYECAERNNVKFMIAHVLRFWPEYVKLKEFYDKKTYGKLLCGTMLRLGNMPRWSWDNWMQDEKRSGFVPFDLHIHDLDFMVYAFGAPKKHSLSRICLENQDHIALRYYYDDFYINAESCWSWAPAPFKASFRFCFEEAVVVFDGTMTVYENSGNVITLSSEADSSGVINLPQTDAYSDELEYFKNCVKNDKPIEVVKENELEAVLKILETL